MSNIYVKSKCSTQTVNDTVFISDIVSYDWKALTVPIDDVCKSKLKKKILYSPECKNPYV